MPPTMFPLFRLRFIIALIAILLLYGWVGQQDYEAYRTAECASSPRPQDYDPVADTCIPRKSHQGADKAQKAK